MRVKAGHKSSLWNLGLTQDTLGKNAQVDHEKVWGNKARGFMIKLIINCKIKIFHEKWQ